MLIMPVEAHRNQSENTKILLHCSSAYVNDLDSYFFQDNKPKWRNSEWFTNCSDKEKLNSNQNEMSLKHVNDRHRCFLHKTRFYFIFLGWTVTIKLWWCICWRKSGSVSFLHSFPDCAHKIFAVIEYLLSLYLLLSI